MAVKTSWSSGDVLTAADLTDTFASKLPYSFGTATPSTTDSGFLWYDSNSTPAAPKFWDGAAFQPLVVSGLELITSSALSGSSVQINGCFTSDYENYLLVATPTFSTNLAFQCRYSASGTPASGSDYIRQLVTFKSTSVTAAAATANAFLTNEGASGATFAGITVQIYRPALAAKTVAFSYAREDSPSSRFETSVHDLATSYDGIQITTSAGTFTGGNVSIYGYKD